MNCDELSKAIREGSVEQVRSLTIGANLARDCPQVPFVKRAVETHNMEIVQLVLDAGADIDLRDEYGELPIYIALADEKMLQFLIARGADVNGQLKDGTPLIHCACMQRKAILKQLIAAGANVHATDKRRKQTPLHIACDGAKADAVAILIQAGADVNALSEYGDSPLMDAVKGKQKSRVTIVDALIKAGANVHHLDNSGNNAFLDAALQGASVEVVNRLVAAGINTQLKSAVNENALEIATRFGQKHLLELLAEICKP